MTKKEIDNFNNYNENNNVYFRTFVSTSLDKNFALAQCANLFQRD